MAIRLDQVPAVALRPARPSIWLWLGLLVSFLLAGAGTMLAFGMPALRRHPLNYWGPMAVLKLRNLTLPRQLFLSASAAPYAHSRIFE